MGLMKTEDKDTILVVDDEEINREMMASNLEDLYRVVTAESGIAALEMCRDVQPDLVLLDVMMGEMSGLEVCRQMQKDKELQEIPVIFITGLNKVDDEDACWEAGGVDFINKPIHYRTLLHRVKSHLKLKHQASELKLLAFRDGLTQIYNRRYMEAHLPKIFKHHLREKQPLSFLMIDIDYFKGYNDLYGHVAGDTVLIEVAKTMQESLTRPQDQVMRYGGEEFFIVLPNTDQVGAVFVAERLNRNIENKKLGFADSPFGCVTVSIGVATATVESKLYSESLMKLADKALYSAKEKGRNQFCVAN